MSQSLKYLYLTLSVIHVGTGGWGMMECIGGEFVNV